MRLRICAFRLLCMFEVPVLVRPDRVCFGISGCHPPTIHRLRVVYRLSQYPPRQHIPFLHSLGWVASMRVMSGVFSDFGRHHTFSCLWCWARRQRFIVQWGATTDLPGWHNRGLFSIVICPSRITFESGDTNTRISVDRLHCCHITSPYPDQPICIGSKVWPADSF